MELLPYPAPLILAAGTSDAESVQVLLEHGVDVGARATRTGETALHAAGCALSLDVARLLLAAGASIDARDSSGGTVLHAMLGQDYNGLECAELLVMLRFLIAHGADLSARDNEGLTPRDVALAAALPADVIALLES